MNSREKLMIGALGAVLLLLAARTVKTQYFARLEALDAEILAKTAEKEKIEQAQDRLRRGKQSWFEAGQRTLGTDESQAATDFRPDIDALVQKCGLNKPVVQLKSTAKVGKNGLRAMNCTVTAEGKLDDILKFLFSLHSKPYVVRCDVLRVGPVTGKDIPKNTLRMTAELNTLLLPADAKKYDLPRVDPVNLRNLAASQPASQPARSKFARLEDYQDIAKRKIFEAWTPPIPPPGKVVGLNPPNNGQLSIQDPQMRWSPAANAKSYVVFFGEEDPPPEMATLQGQTNYRSPKPLEVGKKYRYRIDSVNSEGRTEGDVVVFTAYLPTTPPPPTAPPAPPLDANLILARIISSPRSQQAVLEDPGNKTAVDQRVEVGGSFFGGTLIYVHPKGAVSEKDNQLRFHPLTKALRECVPLTEDSQPLLLFEVMKLEKRAAGISPGPG